MLSGLVLLDKQEGIPSRKADNRLGRLFSTRKIGHLGTLDPFASGLLVIAVGKATKLLPYIDDSTKSYIACLKLGAKTDTGDLTGTIIKKKEVPELDEGQISAVLTSFLGKSSQIPPSYSAIKVNGQVAYKAARKGVELQLKPREIIVQSINLVSYDRNSQEVLFSCTVSKGTYIRVLGEDIASRLGTLGHLSKLRRLSIGHILVSNAKKIDEITPSDLVDPLLIVRGMKHIEVSPETETYVLNGRKLALPDYGEKVIMVKAERPLAVYRREGDDYVCERGLF